MAIALGLKMKMGGLSALVASVITAGMVAWHKFTATTWSGSNRLPDSSPVATNSAALFTGRGLDFDGVNDVVTVGATGATVRTVVFYANPDTTTQAFMQLQSTGAVRIEIASGTLSATGFTTPTLYVNGAASSTVAATTWQQIAVTSATGVSASNLLLGQSNTTFYGGLMSNVKMFSTQLSGAQIAELYANPEQALPTGSVAADLVGWWPMSVNTLYALDGSTNYNVGLISGATFLGGIQSPSTQYGLIGNNTSIFLDGVNDYVALPSNKIAGLSAFSIQGWIIARSSAAFRMVYACPNGTSTQPPVLFRLTTADKLSCFVRTGGNVTATSTNNVADGKLKHVAVVYNGTDIRLYINGILDGTPAAQTGNVSSGSTNDTIGAWLATSVTQYFQGFIFQIATFNAALSASEILELNNQGIDYNLTANTGNYTSSSSLLAFYKDRGNTVANWADLSGNANNATAVNGTPSNAIFPQGTNSSKDILGRTLINTNDNNLLLSGNGYATITDAATLDITTAITLEAWVKPFVVNVAQTIIGKTGSYALGITSGGKPVFTKWTSAASTATATTSTTVTSNTWTHLAAVYDGTNVRLYINGALNTTTAVSGAIDATAADVLLGALTTSTELFNGYIDSAKVYDDDLTAANILNNYTTEASEYA